MNSTTLQTPISYSLHQTLQRRRLELPFDAFAALVARLLPALGYQEVHMAGRRDFKGRNGRDGVTGYDLSATKQGRTVLVQLEQFKATRPLFQRSLDELRGVVLRSGAAEALLITTGGISPSVDRNAHRLAPIMPVSTLSGEELVEQLVRYRIGVNRVGTVDEPFLTQLTKAAVGNSPSDCTGSAAFVVTVGVQRISHKVLIRPR